MNQPEKPRFGVQMYGFGEHAYIDREGCLRAIRQILHDCDYKGVEMLSFWGMTKNDVSGFEETIRKLGLTLSGTHCLALDPARESESQVDYVLSMYEQFKSARNLDIVCFASGRVLENPSIVMSEVYDHFSETVVDLCTKIKKMKHGGRVLYHCFERDLKRGLSEEGSDALPVEELCRKIGEKIGKSQHACEFKLQLDTLFACNAKLNLMSLKRLQRMVGSLHVGPWPAGEYLDWKTIIETCREIGVSQFIIEHQYGGALMEKSAKSMGDTLRKLRELIGVQNEG